MDEIYYRKIEHSLNLLPHQYWVRSRNHIETVKGCPTWEALTFFEHETGIFEDDFNRKSYSRGHYPNYGLKIENPVRKTATNGDWLVYSVPIICTKILEEFQCKILPYPGYHILKLRDQKIRVRPNSRNMRQKNSRLGFLLKRKCLCV